MFFQVFSPEIVHTASFGGDVKPSVPGYWLVLAFSCYVVLHSVYVVSHSVYCGFSYRL